MQPMQTSPLEVATCLVQATRAPGAVRRLIQTAVMRGLLPLPLPGPEGGVPQRSAAGDPCTSGEDDRLAIIPPSLHCPLQRASPSLSLPRNWTTLRHLELNIILKYNFCAVTTHSNSLAVRGFRATRLCTHSKRGVAGRRGSLDIGSTAYVTGEGMKNMKVS